MRIPPQYHRLPDGRLHLNDGPIDLIVEAFGAPVAVEIACAAAWTRFATILDELCGELPILRAQAMPGGRTPRGVVAQRMHNAVRPFCTDHFITPMAAVAGAVAEEILAAMTNAAPLRRAYVNNGGDIALHLLPDESFTIGLIDRPDRPSLIGSAQIFGRDKVRGVATSGWRGRSFSLGIADAVTVLASSAATADAAATLVANAVDLACHSSIQRAPAVSRDSQSDLGERLVTIDVGPLASEEIAEALGCGLDEAERLRRTGLIETAALLLCGEMRVCSVATQLYDNASNRKRDGANILGHPEEQSDRSSQTTCGPGEAPKGSLYLPSIEKRHLYRHSTICTAL
jgi:ApbE superfamily uncharacterized protein (UPF0280 family)